LASSKKKSTALEFVEFLEKPEIVELLRIFDFGK